jgi:hypothetical protein
LPQLPGWTGVPAVAPVDCAKAADVMSGAVPIHAATAQTPILTMTHPL